MNFMQGGVGKQDEDKGGSDNLNRQTTTLAESTLSQGSSLVWYSIPCREFVAINSPVNTC